MEINSSKGVEYPFSVHCNTDAKNPIEVLLEESNFTDYFRKKAIICKSNTLPMRCQKCHIGTLELRHTL